jgi:hypothetical protein
LADFAGLGPLSDTLLPISPAGDAPVRSEVAHLRQYITVWSVASPQVPPPELLLDVRKFCHQMVRGLPFQPLQQSADRHL